MTIDQQQLTDITLGVCETMLGLELTPRSAVLSDWQRHLLASIRISGEWNAILEVSCCESAAKQIAAAMFATDFDSLTDSEIVDSVAEVANMIGGNIKGTVGGESNLSLPCVDTQPTPDASPATPDETDVAFALENAQLLIRLRTTAGANRLCAST